MAIQFFTEDVEKPKFRKRRYVLWISSCVSRYKKNVGSINFIFCSDEYLRSVNNKYLKHDYYTDIITFNYSEKNTLHADIFISIERVQDNSEKFKVDFENEMKRVIIHGILHLSGYNDKTKAEKISMHLAEEECISMYQSY